MGKCPRAHPWLCFPWISLGLEFLFPIFGRSPWLSYVLKCSYWRFLVHHEICFVALQSFPLQDNETTYWNCTHFVSRTCFSHTHSTPENTQAPRQYLKFNFCTLVSAQVCLDAAMLAFSSLCCSHCLPENSLRFAYGFCGETGHPGRAGHPKLGGILFPLTWGPAPYRHRNPRWRAPKLWDTCSPALTQRMDSETHGIQWKHDFNYGLVTLGVWYAGIPQMITTIYS
jgi:hypothetical protein